MTTDIQVVGLHVRRQRVNTAAATAAAQISAKRRKAKRLALLLEEIPIRFWDQETREAVTLLGVEVRRFEVDRITRR